MKKAPIAEAMMKYSADGAMAFHTPGHKQGLGAHPLLKQLLTAEGLRQEVSLMEELDDLHDPQLCIKEAEKLAAELWESREALFMINGTTGAIHAMLMGCLKHGDKLLVPRNAHSSIIGGLIMAGAEPIFIQPAISHKMGVPMGLSVDTVKKAIAANPAAKALIVVYPTYYGVACNLKAIAEVVHSHNMLLLVDEAHGAHLKFSDKLPRQAIACGADIAAQSTHKLLGSMTQTSMLQVGSDRIDMGRLRAAAAMLQSTSPNQLLLASLDIARLQMTETGCESVERAVGLANWLRQEINKIDGLRAFGEEILDDDSSFALDYTKVTVQVKKLGISGIRAENLLRYKYGIQCELSDPWNLLFIISYADGKPQVEHLLAGLQQLAQDVNNESKKNTLLVNTDDYESVACANDKNQCKEKDMEIYTYKGEDENRDKDKDREFGEFDSFFSECLNIPKLVISPRKAFFSSKESVEFNESAGKISAETIAFYPPGIPVLCPGEVIGREIIEYVREKQTLGQRVVGPKDSDLKTIQVVVKY